MDPDRKTVRQLTGRISITDICCKEQCKIPSFPEHCLSRTIFKKSEKAWQLVHLNLTTCLHKLKSLFCREISGFLNHKKTNNNFSGNENNIIVFSFSRKPQIYHFSYAKKPKIEVKN